MAITEKQILERIDRIASAKGIEEGNELSVFFAIIEPALLVAILNNATLIADVEAENSAVYTAERNRIRAQAMQLDPADPLRKAIESVPK